MVPLFHFITCWRHSLLQLLMMSKQNRMALCMPLSMWVCLHLLACVIHRERHMCLSLMITNTYTQRYTNTHPSNTHTPPTAMPTQMCNNTLQVLREFHNTQRMLHIHSSWWLIRRCWSLAPVEMKMLVTHRHRDGWKHSSLLHDAFSSPANRDTPCLTLCTH